VPTIDKLADGKQTLRLTEFEISNGPDVHVYLTGAEVEKCGDAVKAAGFITVTTLSATTRSSLVPLCFACAGKTSAKLGIMAAFRRRGRSPTTSWSRTTRKD